MIPNSVEPLNLHYTALFKSLALTNLFHHHTYTWTQKDKQSNIDRTYVNDELNTAVTSNEAITSTKSDHLILLTSFHINNLSPPPLCTRRFILHPNTANDS
ncbi:hypothetical protein SAMD00019534_126640, partial [Acytostelium subglobosum LB1]|uniref:hypothetical protein n=1 Tax=Acytostelium subglobosum LB1 TaxID=1410327 RepID=UPI000644E7E2